MPEPPAASPPPSPPSGMGAREASSARSARRRRTLRRRRLVALVTLITAVAGLTVALARTGPPSRSVAPGGSPGSGAHPGTGSGGHPGGHPVKVPVAPRPAPSRPTPPFAVGLSMMRLVDNTRSVSLPNGQSAPRTLITYVRYPAQGPPNGADVANAPPARAAAPFPLVVFGHGFAVTPEPYAGLMRAWARAGYVVAAPVFPLENANAPGGPDESDLPNQPADMSVVISRLLAAARAPTGRLSGLIAPREIAVTGQSDGGDSALGAAYGPRYRDKRIGAAMILSGAEIPANGNFQIMPGGPPLIAVQGTADTINPPSLTDAFYAGAPAPKYRLDLLGALHLPPYSSQQPQLGVVERTTIAFLDLYLKHLPGAQQRLLSVGNVPRTARLDPHP